MKNVPHPTAVGIIPMFNRIAAAMIALPCLAVVVAIAHHPTAMGQSKEEAVATIVRATSSAQIIHGAIMVALLLLTAGLIQFSRQRGFGKPIVTVAIIAQCLALVMSFVAMTFDGFAIPEVAARCPTGASACLAPVITMLTLSGICVQVFTKLSFLLMALATLLWSAEFLVHDRLRLYGSAFAGTGAMLAWLVAHLGIGLGALQLWLLVRTITTLTPHTLLWAIAGQFIWYLLVAVWLATSFAPSHAVGSDL